MGLLALLVLALPAHAQANTSAPNQQPAVADAIVAVRAGAALREGPGDQQRSLALLPRGTTLQLTGRNARSTWYHASTADGRVGWVAARHITLLRREARAVPIVTGAAGVQPLPTHSPSGPLTNVNLSRLREVFMRGQAMGNRARAFSKVGDSSVRDQAFLYGLGLNKHTLGPYAYLQATIDWFSAPARDGFANSFVNKSIAAMPAFNSAAAFDSSWTVWTDPGKLCKAEEGPLDCEFRLVRPSVVLLKLGLEDMFVLSPDEYREFMTLIVRHSMARGVIPVVCTFASNPKEPKYPHAGANAEKMNQMLREIAAAEQVPLLELREPVMRLPDLGMNAEGIHVSDWGGDPYNFNADEQRWGITLVNLLTLQMLDKLRVEILSR